MRYIYLLSFLFIFLSGCVGREKMQAINTLRGVASERACQERIIREEKRKYGTLRKNIERGTLKKGLKENEIYRLYGYPVVVKYSETGAKNKILVFYAPLDYFGGSKVYLYLDAYNELDSWEVNSSRNLGTH